MVVFLWWCFCGGVCVLVFLWWCFCGGVLVAVFSWCGCGGVLVVVFLWRCFCGGVVVFLWWCTKYYSSTTKYYSALQSTTPVLQSTTPHNKVILQYYSVLQNTTPVLLRTTKYYSSSTPYYKVLLQYYSNTTLYYKVLLRTFEDVDSKAWLLTSCGANMHVEVITTFPKKCNVVILAHLLGMLSNAVKTTTSGHSRYSSETTLERRPSSTTPYYASTTKASKTSISCEASATFQGTSFQNEPFVRCLCNCHRTMLPKRAFRTMLPTILQEKASKMIVSCEASSKFHRTSFQNERFGDASDNFHEKFAFRYSFAQSTHRFLREGSSAKSKMCFALQRRAFPNVTMCVSPQRRAQKCMNLSTVNRPASRTQKCEVLLQFWAIDTTFLPRGLTESK